jgi:2,5-furandicarboxylate decarboxylase 1
MSYPDLRGFLSDLGHELVAVDTELDPRHEIAAVLRGLGAADPAILCSSIRGYPGVRVSGNLLGGRGRMARAIGTSESELAATYLERTRRGIPPVAAGGSAPVKEVVRIAPRDLLSILPVLTHYEKDVAPFITSGVVLCRDPQTRRRGMGIHRLMVKGGNRLGIFLANPPLSVFHARAEAAGRPLEVAVALGLDPATLVAAVVKSGPAGPDKMDIAGALRGQPVELVRCETVDVEVPARAEAVIEGHVLAGVREPEGPFG